MSDARLYRDFLFDDVKTSGMLTVPTKRILASTPNPIPSPFEPVLPQGSIAYNVVDDTMYFSNGTTWETMGGAVDVVYPLEGDGTAGDPIKIADGASSGNYLVYNAAAIKWAIAPSNDAFGDTNVFLGSDMNTGVIGTDNIAIGVSAGAGLNESNRNVIMGNSAAKAALSTGEDNVVIGNVAMENGGAAAARHVIIGAASSQALGGTDNVVIGYGTAPAATDMTTAVIIGSEAAAKMDSSTANVIIGYQAGYESTLAVGNTLVGASAGYGITTGGGNICIGSNSGLALASSQGNIVMGSATLATLNANGNCVAIGDTALGNYNGADPCVAVGVGALQNIATAGQNVAVGHGAAQNVADSIRSTFVGHNAGISATASLNDVTAIGAFALQNIKTGGDQNTAVGTNAGRGITTGSNNTLVGFTSGGSITTGASNVVVGRNADGTSSAVAQSVIIGAQANGSSNNVVIGFNANDDRLTNCIVLGQGAKATAANQIALATGLDALDTPAGGATPVPGNFSGSVLNVIIGATPYQILLYTP